MQEGKSAPRPTPPVPASIEDRVTFENDVHFRELLTALPNVSVQGYDKNRRVIYWNHASELLYGFTEEEAMGQLLEDLIIPDCMKQGVIDAHHAWVQEGQVIPAGELELVGKDRQAVPVHSSHIMLYQNTHHPEMFCVDVDLSGERKKEKQLDYLTHYDQQTGLHNKVSLFEYAHLLSSRAKIEGGVVLSCSAVFIGIDDLTHINKAYGYDAGDDVIQEFVSRLSHLKGEQDFLARYGGDVFVFFFLFDKQTNEFEHAIEKLKATCKAPYKIGREYRRVTVSVGVAREKQTADAGGYVELLKNAEVAMNQAKSSGKNQWVCYEAALEGMLQRYHALLDALNLAEKNDEFHLVFQPQFDQEKNIVSCEALLRWESEKLGFISPAEFIPLAESKNKIKVIDQWVMSAVIQQLKIWLDQGIEPVPVFINLSGRSLSDPSFVQRLSAEADSFGVPTHYLGIEITEHALITEKEALTQQMALLQDKGVAIALDDFGTGYSSLSYLTRFPLDFIKIDKYFIANAPDKAEEAAITKAIFALSESLGMGVICEGVEYEKHLDFIHTQSDTALLQGYLLSRPVSSVDFEGLIQR